VAAALRHRPGRDPSAIVALVETKGAIGAGCDGEARVGARHRQLAVRRPVAAAIVEGGLLGRVFGRLAMLSAHLPRRIRDCDRDPVNDHSRRVGAIELSADPGGDAGLFLLFLQVAHENLPRRNTLWADEKMLTRVTSTIPIGKF